MRARLLMIAVMLAVAGCGEVNKVPGTATLPPESTAMTVTTLSTTATTLAQAPLPTAAEAASALLGAWQAGDRGLAALVADPPAVESMFAIPVASYESRGCNAGEPDPSYCVYRLDAGELQLRITRRGAGWIVAGAILGT